MYGLFISILIPVEMYTIIWDNMKYLSYLLIEHRRSQKKMTVTFITYGNMFLMNTWLYTLVK